MSSEAGDELEELDASTRDLYHTLRDAEWFEFQIDETLGHLIRLRDEDQRKISVVTRDEFQILRSLLDD